MIWTCSKDGLSERAWLPKGKIFRIESLREPIEPCSEGALDVGESGKGGSSQGETLDGFRVGSHTEPPSVSCKGESRGGVSGGEIGLSVGRGGIGFGAGGTGVKLFNEGLEMIRRMLPWNLNPASSCEMDLDLCRSTALMESLDIIF